MRYAAGFTYDIEDYEGGADEGEWTVERNQFDWLIEALEEKMPKRRNSEVVWASIVGINDGQDSKLYHKNDEIDITQKVIQTLKTRKDT